ncbi:MAG: hypothetical protein ABIS92_10010, partial [Polyangia bacterium]
MAFCPPAPQVRIRRAVLLSLLAVVFSSALGCSKPSSDNIQLWKTTEKGPGKLAEALRDRGTDPKLRAEAAVALVDIGRAEEVDAALATIPASERW